VATLQWEACREGINDLRYLRTLEKALNRAQETLAASGQQGGAQTLQEAIRRGRRFLSHLRKRIQIVPSPPVRPPPDAQEYALLRRAIIGHILALEK